MQKLRYIATETTIQDGIILSPAWPFSLPLTICSIFLRTPRPLSLPLSLRLTILLLFTFPFLFLLALFLLPTLHLLRRLFMACRSMEFLPYYFMVILNVRFYPRWLLIVDPLIIRIKRWRRRWLVVHVTFWGRIMSIICTHEKPPTFKVREGIIRGFCLAKIAAPAPRKFNPFIHRRGHLLRHRILRHRIRVGRSHA